MTEIQFLEKTYDVEEDKPAVIQIIDLQWILLI